MALDPIVWALKDAPVTDAIERLVLAIYAEHADEDGCNAYPSYKTVAERAMTDRRTVIRRVQGLVERRLLAEGDPAAAAAIPQRYRPKVYELMIPHSWWGPAAVQRINAYRVGRGRTALTAGTRPDIDPAPLRTPRADAGRRRSGGQECLPVAAGDGGEGCLSDPGRSDSQIPAGVGDRHPTHPNNPPQEPPPPAPSAPPVGPGDAAARVVVDSVAEDPNPAAVRADVGLDALQLSTNAADRSPTARAARAQAEHAEAMAVVVGANWPARRRPGAVERERLAREVRPCLDRGHPPVQVGLVMTGNLDGARNPVAVAVARLRELATAEPALSLRRPAVVAGERLEPHPYAGEAGRRCTTCRRAEHATVGGSRLHPRTDGGAVRRCEHERVTVNCPTCAGRSRTPGGGHPSTVLAEPAAGRPRSTMRRRTRA